ncbi:hypothetical protein HPB48_026597 [Haemaphysalis longicornis]|uniref:Uncharacterized protein n=1 Tax=Haemaphysalis longicornis TaxID=44386 RepID=A0A9J6HB55_HAELO|nr:hypothetical protein HPB48_026597 [Haemaphysalis longicornis]
MRRYCLTSYAEQESVLAPWYRGAFTAPINYYRAAFRKVPGAGGLKFRKLAIAALILWGRRDFALSRDFATLNLNYARSGRVEYAAIAGLCLYRENPDFFNHHIRQFVLRGEN